MNGKKSGAKKKKADETNGRSKAAQKDYQLARAVDLLHGIALFNRRFVN